MPTFRNQMQEKFIFTERASQLRVSGTYYWDLVFYWQVLFGDQIYGYNCANELHNMIKL